MTMVSEYDWETNSWTHTGDNAARQAWREAVAEIAEKATATLPDCAGRVDSAAKIVWAVDVELLDDGQAKVASQSNGQVVYHVVNGACPCKDYAQAPSNWCQHRSAAGLYKRAHALVQRTLAQSNGTHHGVAAASDPVPVQAEPPVPAQVPAPAEAPAVPAQGIPAQYVVLSQGRPFVKFTGLLHMAHERGLVALTAEWTYNDAELSLAHAVATLGTARVLRDALGVDLVAVEELAEEE